MSASLNERLNQILGLITAPSFLSGKGIGNEIACYIFDYEPDDELKVRDHLKTLESHLSSHHGSLHVAHVNLFDVVIDYLEHRNLLDGTMKMETDKGSRAVLQALKGPIAAEKIRDFIEQRYTPAMLDLCLMSGVGSVWPLLRAHNLLNCLHTILGDTPLVMFYPGSYTGTSLSLFKQIGSPLVEAGSQSYYRAFRLVP